MYTIRLRRGVSARWTSRNPTLADGEPGFETDTGKLKIGDGITPWNDLEYMSEEGVPGDPGSLEAHIVSETPHPVYDEGPSLTLIYQNAKV